MDRNILKVELITQEPHKKYKATIELDRHIFDLCNFLKGVKDKKIEILINNKSIIFTSIANKNKFIEGFSLAGNIIYEHVKKFATEMQIQLNSNINKMESLKKELSDTKNYAEKCKDKLSINEASIKIQNIRYEDQLIEMKENCEFLRQEIERLVIKNV